MCCAGPTSWPFDEPVYLNMRFGDFFPRKQLSTDDEHIQKCKRWGENVYTKSRYMARKSIFRSVGFADWLVRLDRFKIRGS